MNMSAEELEAAIAAGVRRGLNEWADSIGVDTSTVEGRTEIRRDFGYLRAWRQAIESARNTTFTTAITVIVTGAIGALGLYLFGWRQ